MLLLLLSSSNPSSSPPCSPYRSQVKLKVRTEPLLNREAAVEADLRKVIRR